MMYYIKYIYNDRWNGYDHLLEKMLVDSNYITYIRDKKCLDIGTRNGNNCSMMVKHGAKSVTGIDIDDSRFNEMESNENIQLIKQNFFELDNDEKFDVITVFLWNINYSDYDRLVEKIKKLLNDRGIVMISAADSLYRSDTDQVSIVKLFSAYFSKIFVIDNEYLHVYVIY